jgi:hypothetical protein
MKKVLVISLWATIIVVMLDLSFAFGWYDVCIDPGHGGPGAWKYGPNGDDHGTCGPVLKLSEQWVNLQVGLARKHRKNTGKILENY